jgi:hypothetical protein
MDPLTTRWLGRLADKIKKYLGRTEVESILGSGGHGGFLSLRVGLDFVPKGRKEKGNSRKKRKRRNQKRKGISHDFGFARLHI